MVDSEVVLRKATQVDLQGILDLLAMRDARDLMLLRWLPEPFQSRLLEQRLNNGRIFVAVNQNDGAIIAQRKMFIVEDPDELNTLLAQNLRCTHVQRKLIEYGFFDSNIEFVRMFDQHFTPHQRILYIYIGAAFTHPSHQHKRINEFLALYAYDQLRSRIIEMINAEGYTSLALVYGLSDENNWRTIHLARQFLPFAQSISLGLGRVPVKKVSFYAYKRFKPEFTVCPKGNLVQLPDELCRPGRGCVLLYNLF